MNRFVKISIIIIFISFLSLFMIKFYKVNRIIELMKKNSQMDNYYFEDGNISKKRNKDIVIVTFGTHIKSYYYYDLKLGMFYIIDENSKVVYKNDIKNSDKILEFPLYSDLTTDFSFKNKIKLVFDLKIIDYNKDCYKIITKENTRVVFDKNTGFILKSENKNLVNNREDNMINITVNSVSDEDTKRPDFSTYIVYN